MDSLKNLLGDRVPTEPPEVQLIKQYVLQEFKLPVSVVVQDTSIVISSPNAGLVTTLRLRGPVIKNLCQTDKRLAFRIG